MGCGVSFAFSLNTANFEQVRIDPLEGAQDIADVTFACLCVVGGLSFVARP